MRSPEGVWLFYIEFLTETMQISVSILFFIILYTYYGLPVHMVRSVQTRPIPPCAQCTVRNRLAVPLSDVPTAVPLRSRTISVRCRRRPLRNSAVPFE